MARVGGNIRTAQGRPVLCATGKGKILRIGILRSHFLASRGSTEVHLGQDRAPIHPPSSVLADRAVSKRPEVTRGCQLDIASRYTICRPLLRSHTVRFLKSQPLFFRKLKSQPLLQPYMRNLPGPEREASSRLARLAVAGILVSGMKWFIFSNNVTFTDYYECKFIMDKPLT
jgi:hypothetical protein